MLTAGLLLLTDLNDLFLVISAAVLADSVGHNQRTALAALGHRRNRHLPVCSPGIPSCLRRLILRTNRHGSHLLKFIKNIPDG